VLESTEVVPHKLLEHHPWAARAVLLSIVAAAPYPSMEGTILYHFTMTSSSKATIGNLTCAISQMVFAPSFSLSPTAIMSLIIGRPDGTGASSSGILPLLSTVLGLLERLCLVSISMTCWSCLLVTTRSFMTGWGMETSTSPPTRS
jgi:hypothetical protein